MEVELETIERINGYDVTFLKLKSHTDEWITAYVRFDNMKPDDNYGNETYRDGEVVGIDTAHAYNMRMTIEERMLDAKEQIADVIDSYTNAT